MNKFLILYVNKGGNMARYQKKVVVVEAFQIVQAGNYGELGTLETGDYIIYRLNTDESTIVMGTADKDWFEQNYFPVPSTVPLQGTDWD